MRRRTSFPQKRINLVDEYDAWLHLFAKLNKPWMSLFDSPNHLFVSVDGKMDMNVALDSFARDEARSVLPQPGGPNSRTPVLACVRRGADSLEELTFWCTD
jgi:hypothetical protein